MQKGTPWRGWSTSDTTYPFLSGDQCGIQRWGRGWWDGPFSHTSDSQRVTACGEIFFQYVILKLLKDLFFYNYPKKTQISLHVFWFPEFGPYFLCWFRCFRVAVASTSRRCEYPRTTWKVWLAARWPGPVMRTRITVPRRSLENPPAEWVDVFSYWKWGIFPMSCEFSWV